MYEMTPASSVFVIGFLAACFGVLTGMALFAWENALFGGNGRSAIGWGLCIRRIDLRVSLSVLIEALNSNSQIRVDHLGESCVVFGLARSAKSSGNFVRAIAKEEEGRLVLQIKTYTAFVVIVLSCCFPFLMWSFGSVTVLLPIVVFSFPAVLFYLAAYADSQQLSTIVMDLLDSGRPT